MRDRIGLVDKSDPEVSVRRQCELWNVARSTVDCEPVPESAEDLKVKRLLDEIDLIDPCSGSRRLVTILQRDYGLQINRKRVQRLRRESTEGRSPANGRPMGRQMGQETIFCRPRTSIPDQTHRTYPYLLRDINVERPNQVWCADICRHSHGEAGPAISAALRFLCSDGRGQRLSMCGNGLAFAQSAGPGRIEHHGYRTVSERFGCSHPMRGKNRPGNLQLAGKEESIMTARLPSVGSDQGSQFTSQEWTRRLTEEGIRISINGRGRWMDNVFIERLWRSVKYEEIHLREHMTLPALEAGLKDWIARYNTWRPHQALGNRTPDEVHRSCPFRAPAADASGQAA